MKTLFENQKKILLVHDYKDRIGGAEVYVESLEKPFREMGKTVAYAHYENKTSRIKRKFLFASAILGYFRQRRIQKKLAAFRPDTIWMHSVLRYHGIWSIRQIQKYIQKYPNTKVYLSHHDIGLLAPFPQDITQEEQIPKNDSLKEFTKGLKGRKKAIATLKWLYVLWLKKNLPKSTEHIIFAPFLAKHIHNHFGDQRIIILPHTFDEQIFHP
jgi:glycosyltransferase involved in cell wall biosynthesis